jgi:hypothetical protein
MLEEDTLVEWGMAEDRVVEDMAEGDRRLVERMVEEDRAEDRVEEGMAEWDKPLVEGMVEEDRVEWGRQLVVERQQAGHKLGMVAGVEELPEG